MVILRPLLLQKSCLKCCERILLRRMSSTSPYQPPWRVLFLGSDDFSLPHLRILHDNLLQRNLIESLEVVIPKAKSISKMCSVGRYAMKEGIQGHLWPYLPSKDQFDVGVVASFGHLLPMELIQAFPHGIINVHPSLLPQFRGSAPINHTILRGDSVSGVTIMQIAPDRFDEGPILLQEKTNVRAKINATDLRAELSSLGSKMLLLTLSDLLHVLKNKQPQSQREFSKAPKIKLKHALVNWEQQTPQDIDRQYRALTDFYLLQSEWLGHSVKFNEMVDIDDIKDFESDLPAEATCGTPFLHRGSNSICIKCQGGWVAFRKLVYKKPMTPEDFHNGFLSSGRNEGQSMISAANSLEKYYESNKIPE